MGTKLSIPHVAISLGVRYQIQDWRVLPYPVDQPDLRQCTEK